MTQTQIRDWHPLAALREMASPSTFNSSTTLPNLDYEVEDAYPDTTPAPDVWAEYLRARILRRRELYNSLDPSAQELIRKEVRRIRYFREHFKDYRVFPTDELPLVALLDDSRTKWRDIAAKRANDELNKVNKRMEKEGATELLVRNKKILKRVQSWHSKGYADIRDASNPDAYMPDLDQGPDNSEDDPQKPDYGYNGWVIAWEKGQWTSLDHPLVHGSFPHQKISIQQFLYNKEGTPLKRDLRKDQFRYFHLPANNMKWVEEAVQRYYGEDKVDFDGTRALSRKYNSQRLLRPELWRGQQRGGHNLPAHARQIGPRCSVVSSAPLPPEYRAEDDGHPRKDVALFMPYLHWEVEKRLHRMGQFVQVAKSHNERLRRATTFRQRARMANIASKQALKKGRAVASFEPEKEGFNQAWRPRNALAKYFWHVAKLHQIIDEAADGRLVEDHLYSTPPLHMRRTLEQFYYWTAEDTSRRDKSQVVCKGTRYYGDEKSPEASTRIVMVDQLWLWILDDNTVISAFPRRWGRNKPDPSAVHRSIRDRMGALDPDEIQSVYDLALIVIDECSRVFFDPSKLLDQRPEVVDLFSSAISKIAENKTIAYEGFGLDLSRISLETLESAEKLLRKSLNISFEWSILEEAQQVLDELQIMQEIFDEQIRIMRELDRLLADLLNIDPHEHHKRPGSPASELRDKWQKTRDHIDGLISDMEQRKDELEGMEVLQMKTRVQLRDLVDMKQQQANVVEAKAAIRRADESVLQGRSIVVFTVVTIFFVSFPLK